MVTQNSETPRNRREVERLRGRLCARDRSSTPANYDSFTFRPTGQAADIRNPFAEAPSNPFITPTPSISPWGFPYPEFNPSKARIEQPSSNQDRRYGSYPGHANSHPLSSIPPISRTAIDAAEENPGPSKALQMVMEDPRPGKALGEGSYGLTEVEETEWSGSDYGGSEKLTWHRATTAESNPLEALEGYSGTGPNSECDKGSEAEVECGKRSFNNSPDLD